MTIEKYSAHMYFMNRAIHEAYKGIKKGDGGPFGCVIVQEGKIIAKAHNEVIKNNDPTCHGEIQAIRKACKQLKTFDLSGCILYTTGYPCPMCLGAIQWANISEVYYACNLSDTEELGFRDDIFYKNKLKPKEIGRYEGLKLYDSYKNLENKINY